MNLPHEELMHAASALRSMRFPAAYTATRNVATLVASRNAVAELLEFHARRPHEGEHQGLVGNESCPVCAAIATARKILFMHRDEDHG